MEGRSPSSASFDGGDEVMGTCFDGHTSGTAVGKGARCAELKAVAPNFTRGANPQAVDKIGLKAEKKSRCGGSAMEDVNSVSTTRSNKEVWSRSFPSCFQQVSQRCRERARNICPAPPAVKRAKLRMSDAPSGNNASALLSRGVLKTETPIAQMLHWQSDGRIGIWSQTYV